MKGTFALATRLAVIRHRHEPLNTTIQLTYEAYVQIDNGELHQRPLTRSDIHRGKGV